MGRIKTAQVKTLADEFIRVYPERFSLDFEQNKRMLESSRMEFKWLRNRVAGYITKRMRQRARGVVVTPPQQKEEAEEQ